MATRKRLAIIGAGPKAMAIASKATVLAELGYAVPEIHIIEKSGIGANWTGNSGFTNGRLHLGTSPEKDVGFPYNSDCWGAADGRIDGRMKEFSWQSHLIAIGRFSDWVDQGRPAPQHREWAEYLQWVWSLAGERTQCHHGEVTALSLSGNAWSVTYEDGGERRTLECDGLVATGPGKIRLADTLPNHDRLMTVESFWKNYRRFADMGPKRVALIGTGENAAAIAQALAGSGNEELAIHVLSPSGMTFSRGESFRENRVYSSAAKGSWNTLSAEDRREFMYRTDRGVFSLYAQRALDGARNLDVIPGRMAGVTVESGDRLMLTSEYDGRIACTEYDYVVVATGSDQLAFLGNLMDHATRADVIARAGLSALTGNVFEGAINHHLAVEGLTPFLHLPMLSGLAQGPGFANLSCLGRLSDRILRAYVE